jgi:type IV secretion system protein VirD4
MQNTSQQRKKLKQKQQQKIKKVVTGAAAQPKSNIVPAAQVSTPKTQQTAQLTLFDKAQNTVIKNYDYFAVGAVILFVFVVILQKIGIFKLAARIGGNRGGDQHGTAGFAKPKEIKQLTARYEDGNIKVGKIRDIELTKLVNLPRDIALKHTVIVGPTGSGKSRGFFLPNCFAAGRSSFVATDPKSELWAETAYNNIKPVRFAPSDPDNSIPCNFVAYCKEIDYAQNVAASIVSGSGGKAQGDSKFWADSEEELVTGLLLHVANSDVPTPVHLYNLLISGVESISETLKISPIPAARALVAGFMESDKKNKGGIVKGLSGKLQFLNNPAIRRFTSSGATPFNFGQLREKPIQVYWCLEQDEVASLETLSTIFFSIVVTQLLKQKTGDIPVNLHFDEFANIGKLKGFANNITLFRGQKICINAGLQSLSQIETLYGDTEAETIFTNFNNKLLLAGISGDTAEEFSKQLGDYTYHEDTVSTSESSGKDGKTVATTRAVAKHARRLLTADEVRRLGTKEIILISTNLRPVRMKKLEFNPPPKALKRIVNCFKAKPAEVNKKPKFQIKCGQELAAPEYERIEAKKKVNLDDV